LFPLDIRTVAFYFGCHPFGDFLELVGIAESLGRNFAENDVCGHALTSFTGLFIKNVDAFFTSTMSVIYPDIVEYTFQEESFYIHRRFLPCGRVDLTTSASL